MPTTAVDQELKDVPVEEADDVGESFHPKEKEDMETEETTQKVNPLLDWMDIPHHPRKSVRFEDLVFEDSDESITYGRRLQRFLSRFYWYQPSGGASDEDVIVTSPVQAEDGVEWKSSNNQQDGNPELGLTEGLSVKAKRRCQLDKSGVNLDSAWAYFEHIALPRRIVAVDGGLDMVKAQPGDTDKLTELYPVWSTPETELGEFGIGVGAYFLTMRYLTLMCILVSLFYLPTILYYAGSDYDDTEYDYSSFAVRGSAICLNTRWVPCDDCSDANFESDRIASFTLTNTTYTFAKKNLCEGGTIGLGLNHIIVLLFVVSSIYVMGIFNEKAEDRLDEANLTTSDYSIKISDPPPDATDPEVWKDYFEKSLGVIPVYVTVSLNNEELIKALVERRAIVHNLSLLLPSDVNLDDDEEIETAAAIVVQQEGKSPLWKKFLRKLGIMQDAQTLADKLEESHDLIVELLQQNYEASSVFVVFGTEEDQRKVLTNLTVGTIAAITNNQDAIDDVFLFHGTDVLHVEEAGEPSDVRWTDLSCSNKEKIIRIILTSIPVIGLIVLGAVLVTVVRNKSGPFEAGFTISALNFIIPTISKVVTSFERHTYVSLYQASLYTKITIFRWINTAVITTLTTSFTLTIADDALISAILGVFTSEMITVPALQILDIMGNINRHILGPRCQNQFAMNAKFRGTPYNLAERYTNMSKVLFLVTWYSVIFPAGYFFGAIAFTIQYYADKFCLLRTWSQQPAINNSVGRMGRRAFYPMLLCAMAVLGSYFWAGFPYDNLCQVVDDEEMNEKYSSLSPSFVNLSIEWNPDDEQTGNKIYRYCSQDFLGRPNADSEEIKRFPAYATNSDNISEGGWMTDQQEVMAHVYAWTSVFVIVISCVLVLFRSIVPFITSLVKKSFDTDEAITGTHFLQAKGCFAYTPEVKHNLFDYPLLACDLSYVKNEHVSWEDPLRSYKYYSLALDIDHIKKIKSLNVPDDKLLLAPIKRWTE